MSTVVAMPKTLENHGDSPMDSAAESGTKFHLSLNVSNLERMSGFLQAVLGVPPVKLRADYAKFELDSPPLVLSLEPHSPREAGSLNHLGFRLSTTAELVDAQRRLEAAGISTRREEGVECCYAKQTKFWVHDPDQRLWEFYVLEGDLEHRGQGQTLEQMVGSAAAGVVAAAAVQPVIWEHRMGSPFALPLEPCTHIRLRGTFNMPTAESEMTRILSEVYRHLLPGGQVELHTLTSEAPVPEPLNLPGPAAHVRHVPQRRFLLEKLLGAGFADVQLTTFRSGECFQAHGLPLRETKIVAYRPGAEPSAGTNVVRLLYRGPFAEIVDDLGNRWRRGEWTAVAAARWEDLCRAGLEAHFTLLPVAMSNQSCGA